VNKGAFKFNAPYQDYPPTYLASSLEPMDAGMPNCLHIYTTSIGAFSLMQKKDRQPFLLY